MKTGAALFLCLAMATPASASDPEACRQIMGPAAEANNALIGINEGLNTIPFDLFNTILLDQDKHLSQELAYEQERLSQAINQFVEKQTSLLRALDRCQ